jgi:hypothetical protein
MTTYSHTVTFTDNELISIENMLNEKIEVFKKEHGESLPVPYWWFDILNKLKNAKTELTSWTSHDENGTPIININL